MSSTTTATRNARPKSNTRAQSERIDMPASLDFWVRRSEDNTMNIGASPTFGLQQMRGYDDLDHMHRKGLPMQWADDDRSKGKGVANPNSTSSIAFPTLSNTRNHITHNASNRSDGTRFTSLPTRHHLQAPYRPSRHSIMAPRLALTEQNGNQTNQRDTSASSSGTSSPEGKVASLEPLNLRQRSIKSLRGIASAWVPSAVKSPYDSENETTPTKTPKGKAKEVEERRPIKLDRRRLNKAVSLAVEAAQASEQDQKIWKQKKRRLARQQALMKSTESNNRFATLPWKRNNAMIGNNPTDSETEGKEGALVAYKHRGSLSNSENDDDEDEGDSDHVIKRAGVGNEEMHSSDSDDSEQGAIPDDFSVDLYVSSLTYLLTALSPSDVENVGPRHREEMKRKLQEALKNLEKKDELTNIDSADREEVIRLRVERELALMQQAYFQRQGIHSTSSRAHQAAQASSSQQRNQKQSVAGYLASSAIDLGLSVGAGALAAASRGVASLVSLLTANSPSHTTKTTPVMEPTSIEEIPSDDEQHISLALPPSKNTSSSISTVKQNQARPMLTHSQWELTRTLAHSVASTMYNNLAAVAEQRKVEMPNQNHALEMTMYDLTARGSTLSTLDKPDDASDQLLIMAATLARNVKRSPLPSQVKALTSQVVSLIGALDEKYSISKRSADVALRKTGQALYYVRKNDLHVKALRAVWAIIEASVAAIEAYRDEEEWKGHVTLQKGIEARPASR